MTQPAEHGYRNFLSLDAIIAEARAVADTEGLEAVSMRVLAKRLGCTPRALYRHVTDKDEVLELLADRALADVAQIVAQQPVAGPEFRRHAERLVGLLLDAGFQPDVAVEAVVALAQFTLGASMPGTGQRLHDTYRARQPDLASDARPALSNVTRHFAAGDADARFGAALRRLIRAYEETAPS